MIWVGTLTGQGLQQAYNINTGARKGLGHEASVRIISSKKFSTIVLTTGKDYFEFSNVLRNSGGFAAPTQDLPHSPGDAQIMTSVK